MKKRGMTRLGLTALAAALCLVWSGLGWGTASAEAAESSAVQPYNIVLLIDKSGSMNATDPGDWRCRQRGCSSTPSITRA